MRDNSTLWFNLCLGDWHVDDEGMHHYSPTYSRLSILSATRPITDSLERYREELHRLLDSAIDVLQEELQRDSEDEQIE